MKSKLTVTAFLLISVALIFSCAQPSATQDEVANTENVNWSNKVIYEVNIRQFTAEGTFAAFEDHIPRLKELGVDILWLMPIFSTGEKYIKATSNKFVEEIKNPEERAKYLGSYYSSKDYLAVNADYGTVDEFKALVQKIHDSDMFVILDIAANHTAWDHVWFETHPEYYTKIKKGTIPWNPEWMKEHPEFFNMLKETGYTYPIEEGETDWWDTAELNYKNEDLRSEMKNVLKFWIEECNIDGYRCDMAGKVPTDFWEDAISGMRKIKPLLMLSEWETPEHLVKAFDMNYTWTMMHTMEDIVKGHKDASYIDSVLENQNPTYQKDDIRMYFTTNHDENAWAGTVFERYGDGAKTFSTLCFTLNGMPLLHSGQEVGLNKRLRFFEKDTINWNDSGFSNFYKVLTKLKHNNEALWCGENAGDFIKVTTSNDKEIYSFVRQTDSDKIFVILNLSNKAQNVEMNSEFISGEFEEAFSLEKLKVEKHLMLGLQPWEYKVFVK